MKTINMLIVSALLGTSGAACAAVLPPVPQPETAQEERLPELRHKHTDGCAALNPDSAHIVCIIDKSGSMSRLTSDTIGGFNGFIERQKKEKGEAAVTTYLFNDKVGVLHEAAPLRTLPAMTEREYRAGGTTALLDAVGKAITDADKGFAARKTCPASEPTIFLIITDGLENASAHYTRGAIRKLISDAQEFYKWQFVFMGANIDSFAEASSIGINRSATMDYSADGDGIGRAFESAGRAVKAFRAAPTEAIGEDWKKDDENGKR